MNELADFKIRNTFCDLSSEELVEKVHQRMDEKRFLHCIRTSKTAEGLAELYHANVDRAQVAGLIHDYAKEIPIEDFKKIIVYENLDPDLLNWNRAIWHGVVGTYFIEHELGITDQAILDAVKKHTTGAPEMTTLDKIVFVADYIEPARDFSGAIKTREAAKTSLDSAVGLELTQSIEHLVSEKLPIYPETIISYNVWGTN